MRRDEFRSAQIFFREAYRLDPSDTRPLDFLDVLDSWIQPTAAVEKLPAATVAVGPFSPPSPSSSPSSLSPRPSVPSSSSRRRRRLALGTQNGESAPDAIAHPTRFGAYLVRIGALTPAQLREALDYHRRTAVRVGTAAAILGFTTKPVVEWAAQAFHASPRR